MLRMLIVDDDTRFAQAWESHFSGQSFFVDRLDQLSSTAHLQGASGHYDIIILDAGRNSEGVDTCRQFRSAGGVTPVLLTTTKHSTDELEQGLDAGADDYMAKPIKLRELSARVRALLRRPVSISSPILCSNHVSLDTTTATVTVAGQVTHLHPMEFNLLEFLLRHQGKIFSADALLERVWDNKGAASVGSVRTHIKTLRHKLQGTDKQGIIETVRGRGYKIM